MARRLLQGALLSALAGLAACNHVDEADDTGGDGGTDGGADSGADTDTGIDTDTIPGMGFTGIDLLMMVDDSSSMTQEQTALVGPVYSLVSALVSPLSTSPFSAVDELRIAVVTSNMGFSSDGQSNDEYWPGYVVDECVGFGDNGIFQTVGVESVELPGGAIPCDATGAQCPVGWTCAVPGGEEIGFCDPAGEGTVACPGSDAAFMETDASSPNPAFATEAACLAKQGTSGCGFEQQLASISAALARPDQAGFVVDTHLLAILAVTDEDDCSMRDGKGMFESEEITDQSAPKVNIACAQNPEFLFSPHEVYERLVGAKQPGAVVFAVIAGVPAAGQDPAGAAACQGWGDQLGDCLAQEAMQYVPEQLAPFEDAPWFLRPACTRTVDEIEITRAPPARRFVELAADEFGAMGYVYSICNEDWSPAFEDVKVRLRAYLAL